MYRKLETNNHNLYKWNIRDTKKSDHRRNENRREVRQYSKEYHWFKRRNTNNIDKVVWPLSTQNNGQSSALPTVEQIVDTMLSENKYQQFTGMIAARKMICDRPYKKIDERIYHSVVPIAIKLLQDTFNPIMQFEAAWVLTNIASRKSERIQSITYDAIPHLIILLQSKSISLVEQAAWVLAKIAEYSSAARDKIINCNVVPCITKIIHNIIPFSVLRIIVWLMINLCDNKNSPPAFDQIQLLIPVLSDFLCVNDISVAANACWALSYVTNVDNNRIQVVVEAGVVPRLIIMLGSEVPHIIAPALRTVSNIVCSGTDYQIDKVIEAKGLQKLAVLLRHNNNNIVLEAAYAIGHITAGNQKHIQAVLDSNLLTNISYVLKKGDFRSKKEAIWTVTNITTNESIDQVRDLWEKYDLLKPFSGLLNANNDFVVKIVLTGISNCFGLAKRTGNLHNLCVIFEKIGGLRKLQGLQYHKNKDVYRKACALIGAYFTNTEQSESKFTP
ncbi:importin subunit alpha-like [Teleopsis dalmanni]|uniref:importin subunit alpha-like n=1 Tax=Teleopsis dalmanni TaxID=139649 RepID=UPI0018CC816F|nr:importin subunit alpha-like [Teleopsis dalmanni]